MRQLPVVALDGASRGGRLGGGLLALAVVVAVVAGSLILLMIQVRQTWLMTSPDVQRAEVHAKVAEDNQRSAELERQTANIRAQQAAETAWQPWTVGASHLALLALLVGVAAMVALVLAAGVLMFRRHLSLPTRDGRVPLVGLDRELSREALLSYQRLALRGDRPTYEVLPVDQPRQRPQFDVVEAHDATEEERR